jgi:redox-sensitive bicupin YhaK (pirin superfamily)
MKTIYHQANSRGHANHGWLDSYHTFSFAGYHDPERIYFGALRVLNDDRIAGGRGFGMHPHDNMEIITIPLAGDLRHKDSMGNEAVIREGDVQVMSAGTGVFHSEFNHNSDRESRLLQIWVFPDRRNVTPRYDQITVKEVEKENEFYQILSPNAGEQGVWIYQHAWFHLGKFTENKSLDYELKDPQNGLYVFVIAGQAVVAGNQLNERDGLGLSETGSVGFDVTAGATLLLMEVPMHF